MRVPLIATRDLTYATRRLKAGDEFEAGRIDARVLTAIGRAKLVPAKAESDETEIKKPAKRTAKRASKKDEG